MLIPILLLAGSLLTQAAAAQETASFKADATYIRVPVSVFDSKGKVVTNLTRDQFHLLDEGEPRQIQNFVLDRMPIHVLLLLDVSGSLREELDEIRRAAVGFAESFGREDRIAVMTFSDRIELLQDWTNDLRSLRRSLEKIERGYRTALYDALLATAREKLLSVPGKKVIILLTDGLDNESRSNFEDVIDTMVRSQISLYIVSRTRLVQPQVEKSDRVEFINRVMKNVLNEKKDFVKAYFREKEVSMTHLAEATGGRTFFPERLESLSDHYAQLAAELKGQYVLTFLPPASSTKRFRRIQVTCTEEVEQIYYRAKYWWGDAEAPTNGR